MNTLRELENKLEPSTYAELVRISHNNTVIYNLLIEADRQPINSHELLARMTIILAQTASLLYEN